jgi:hypothetical protein
MHQRWKILSIFYANQPMENIKGCLAKKCPMEFKNNSYIYRKPTKLQNAVVVITQVTHQHCRI